MKYTKSKIIVTNRFYTPHSLSSFDETRDHPRIRKLLIEINKYYSVYSCTPPPEYLRFVMPAPLDKVMDALKFLTSLGWFSMAYRGNIMRYHITTKFKKAFYHSTKGIADGGIK